jgi:hypothetical protein
MKGKPLCLRSWVSVTRCLVLAVLSASVIPCCRTIDETVPATCWTHASAGGGSVTCDASGTDDHEPNDTLASATSTTGVSCDQSTVTGVISGDDVDMYQFDAQLCSNLAYPTLTFNGDLKASQLRMCLFVTCGIGSTSIGSTSRKIEGCVGGDAKFMPEGALGCCSTEENALTVNLICSNYKQDVHAFVVIDNVGESNECRKYSVTYEL